MGPSTHPRGTSRRLSVAFLTILAAAIATPTPTAAEAPDNDGVTVARTPALYQYRAFRKMHAVVEKLNQEGWLQVLTESTAEHSGTRSFRREDPKRFARS